MESDDALVERSKIDPVAFGEIYERYVDKIFSYIFHRTGSRLDAEDLTAHTFYQALTNIQDYTDRGLPLSAWLYRIAHNAVANWHRDRHRRPTVSLDHLTESPQPKGNPYQAAETWEREQALLRAMRKLHPDRQLLLILKFTEGLSNAQIGEIMDRSEGAVKSLYHRTLVALRDHMEEQGFG